LLLSLDRVETYFSQADFFALSIASKCLFLSVGLPSLHVVLSSSMLAIPFSETVCEETLVVVKKISDVRKSLIF